MSPEEKYVLVERLKALSTILQTRVNCMEVDVIHDFDGTTIGQLFNSVRNIKDHVEKLDAVINQLEETIRGIS